MAIDTNSERFRAFVSALADADPGGYSERRDDGLLIDGTLSYEGLAAALEAWEAAAWRPIEECPNDGEDVLTWEPGDRFEVLCIDGSPFFKWRGPDRYVDSNPTHFRLLPPPPQDPAP